MEINYAEENAFMTVEDFERIVARIPKKRFIHQEWMQTDEHASDAYKDAFNAFKDPIVVEADKKSIRWLSDFISD